MCGLIAIAATSAFRAMTSATGHTAMIDTLTTVLDRALTFTPSRHPCYEWVPPPSVACLEAAQTVGAGADSSGEFEVQDGYAASGVRAQNEQYLDPADVDVWVVVEIFGRFRGLNHQFDRYGERRCRELNLDPSC